jgi:hypothetical protein
LEQNEPPWQEEPRMQRVVAAGLEAASSGNGVKELENRQRSFFVNFSKHVTRETTSPATSR